MESGMNDRLNVISKSDDLSKLKLFMSSQVWVLSKTIDGYTILHENRGMIPQRIEFERMVSECMEFYDNHDDHAISEHNSSCLFVNTHNLKQKKIPSIKMDKSGYIYLIESSSGHHKIGQSKNPKRRLKELQKGAAIGPFTLDMICYFKVKNMDDAEQYLHELYHDSRVNGEWFLLSSEQIEQIKKGLSYV